MKILKPREEVIYGSSAIPPSEYIPNQTEKLRTINGESAYYTFLGWKDDYSYIIEDTLIDSLWVKSPILKIYDCSGEEIFNNHVPYGSNFELPIIEENFNFKFLNWDNNIYINNNILYNIVLDITLTAECLEKHQITIFNCNGEIESQLFDIYADPDYLATLQKLSDYEYLIICPPKKIIVTYITDLGDIYAREELEEGEIAPSITPDLTYSCLAYDHLDGYDFSPLTEDITITAVYIPTKYNLTVLYLDTNHEEIWESQIIPDLCLGTSYTITPPDIPNYEFVSWSDGFPYKENEINILGETSVIATFKKCEYNLTFVNTDGTIRDRQVVAHGVTPIFPVLTPDSCETNLSWQENGVDASPKAVTEDHIYKAVASKKTITITKNLCGGNTSTETITCGTRYNPAGSWILNGDPYTAQELTLDTILTQADCSITIKFDDGGNIQSFDIPRNSKLNTTPTTSRPNKTFLGWFRGDEQFSTETTFTTNTTFYARYESLTCNVTYKINNEEVRKLTVEANALFKLYYPEDQVITWHTDSSLHNPITGDYYSTPTDLILYGKIILKSYTLTINQCNGDTLTRHLAEGAILTGAEDYFQKNTLTATYSYNIRFPYTIKSDVTINETCKTLNCAYVVNYLDTQGNTIGYSQTGIAAYGSSKTFTALDIEGYESPSLTELTVLFVPDSTYYVGGKFVINFVYTRLCIVTFVPDCEGVTFTNGDSIKVLTNTLITSTKIPAYTIAEDSCISNLTVTNTKVTTDTTITVLCVPAEVTITFSANDPTGGHNNFQEIVTIPCGTSLRDNNYKIPDCPQFVGYDGVWIGETTGIDYYNHNFTLDELITCSYIPNYVSVQYYILYGSESEEPYDTYTQKVIKGGLVTLKGIPNSTRSCYTAPSKWQIGSDLYSPNSTITNITADLKAVAKYTQKSVSITYLIRKGTTGTWENSPNASTPQPTLCGKSTTILALPDIDGYETPDYWSDAANSENTYSPGASSTFSIDTTLRATYTNACTDATLTKIDTAEVNVTNDYTKGLNALITKANIDLSTVKTVTINDINMPYSGDVSLHCGDLVLIFTAIDATSSVYEAVFTVSEDGLIFKAGRIETGTWYPKNPAAFRVTVVKNGNSTNGTRKATHSSYLTFNGTHTSLKYAMSPTLPIESTGNISVSYSGTPITSEWKSLTSNNPDISIQWICSDYKYSGDEGGSDTVTRVLFKVSGITSNDIVIVNGYGRLCVSDSLAQYLNIMSGHYSNTTLLPCLYYCNPVYIFIGKDITDWTSQNSYNGSKNSRRINNGWTYKTIIYHWGEGTRSMDPYKDNSHTYSYTAFDKIKEKTSSPYYSTTIPNFTSEGGTVEQFLIRGGQLSKLITV